ncbi:hypothetical protein LSTR_LSTR015108 [Laodelphax striatellus]|uniref:Uncharacterized protein n=1 Tax=Laodelphax striatellus TaxID=195883 RepID=A0A482WVF9_LAOST|nr:hypothetical protein LSTR_LSTR015108 [Laodelphax striatellus]
MILSPKHSIRPSNFVSLLQSGDVCDAGSATNQRPGWSLVSTNSVRRCGDVCECAGNVVSWIGRLERLREMASHCFVDV